ncbi:MAG TPA: M28 family peptidase [Trueperaceae bacterium]|nr:M28 family peptidase [Trueperaceae bacterium]
MNDLEKQVLDDISLEHPWELIEKFSTMVREHPTDVNRAADVIADRLRGFGVPVTMYEPRLFLSLPRPSSVKAGGKEFRAKAPSMSAIAADGLTAQMVYVAAGHDAEVADDVFDFTSKEVLTKTDVRGKIVITDGFAGPANVAEFEAAGAVGVIAVNLGVDVHWGTCTSIWGSPDLYDLPRKPKIPALAVSRPDGEQLIEMAARGGEATMIADLEEGWYDSKLPVVEIPGSVEPDKFVLLHGHYDSWDVGVGDNATGDATMLEVARVLWNNRSSLRRSVRIAWWPGHSTGRYAGSTWFADEFAIDLDENCVAHINCDSPGCRWATEYKDVSLTAETESFAANVIRDAVDQPLYAERAHQAGDYSFNNIGISGYFMLLSTMPDDLRAAKGYYAVGGAGGNIAWHTENDTLEIADRDILLKDIRIYLLAALRNANVEVLPFDWRATADEFSDVLEKYQAKAGASYDFGKARAAIGSFKAALDGFYSDLQAGKVPAQAANAVIQRLARLLIPVNFTRELRFWHDPALTIPQLPDLSVAVDLADLNDRERGFALTHLTRGQNRLVATLREATRLVEGRAA